MFFSLCFDDNFYATLDMGRKRLDKPIWWSQAPFCSQKKHNNKKFQPRWQIAQQEIEKEIQAFLDVGSIFLNRSFKYYLLYFLLSICICRIFIL